MKKVTKKTQEQEEMDDLVFEQVLFAKLALYEKIIKKELGELTQYAKEIGII